MKPGERVATRDRTRSVWAYQRGTIVSISRGQPTDSVLVKLDGQKDPAMFWDWDVWPLSVVDRIGEIEVGPGHEPERSARDDGVRQAGEDR